MENALALEIPVIDVNADLFRIAALCQSTESTRYYLNGVLIEPNPRGGVNLVATDGHRLLCIHDESGKTDQARIVRLPETFLKACKSKKTRFTEITRRLIVKSDGKATVIIFNEGSFATSGESVFVDGTFPDWRRTAPRPEIGTLAGWFNPAYMTDFATIARELKAPSFRLASEGENNPAMVIFTAVASAFGILMPMKGANYSAPDFHLPPKPELPESLLAIANSTEIESSEEST